MEKINGTDYRNYINLTKLVSQRAVYAFKFNLLIDEACNIFLIWIFFTKITCTLTENLCNLLLKDVISNKQRNVCVDLVKTVSFMKLVAEIRIDILDEQFFMYAVMYIFKAKIIMFS